MNGGYTYRAESDSDMQDDIAEIAANSLLTSRRRAVFRD